MGNNMVLLPLPTMQEMMGLPGRVTAFNIAVDRPDDPQGIESVLNRLGGAFPELRFWETKDAADNSEILRSMRATAWSVSVIAIVMGTVIVTNTLLMSVNERTREIGVLSAVGWSAGRIQGMIVLEGMLLTLAGSLAGAALGLAGVGVLTSHPRVRGFVDTDMSGALIAEVAGAAILLGLLASAYPAWRAVRINVMDAIHHE
jgi:putative ABC transport system permease protein